MLSREISSTQKSNIHAADAGVGGCHPTWIGRSKCRECPILNDVLFATLSAQDLDGIVEGIYEPIDEYRYEAGAILYREGQVDNAIYTVRDGLIKLVRYLPDGRERIIRLVKTASSIGLERLLGRPYGHTAIALRPVQACRIPIDVMQHLDQEQPRFYRQLMERWATLLFEEDDYVMMLLSGTVKQRVTHLIQWLCCGGENCKTNKVELLAGKDMAAMVGLTVESVSRTLADIKRQGILQQMEGEQYKFDANRLKAYAQSE